MFSSLPRNSYLKQPVPFVASLWLQVSVLLIVCNLSSEPSHFSIRNDAMHAASVMPIVFQKEIAATPGTPDPEPTEPRVKAKPLSEEQPVTPQDANTQAKVSEGSSDASDSGEGNGLVPFAGLQLNAPSSSFTVMHHQVKSALPVFTPDPPILHDNTPELARGKDVVLDVVIDSQGSIVQVAVVKGVGYGVEASIVQTLRRWIFVPAKVNEVAVASRRQLRFHFPG